jgi:hypothetical protein
MRLDRGNLFLGFMGLFMIVLFIALTAAVITDPVPGNNDILALGATDNMPQPAQPVIKTANYPGIPTNYGTAILVHQMDLGGSVAIKNLVLNGDGTITVDAYGSFGYGRFSGWSGTFTGGHWYKVKGKGHTIYIDGSSLSGIVSHDTYNLDIIWKDNIATLYKDNWYTSMTLPKTYDTIPSDYYSIFCMDSYNDWDAGYATMTASPDLLAPYIDSCVPAEAARPYIEQGYTGQQAVPYIVYNMPVETAAYFMKQGISADLCGPYIAAGASKEDTEAYLNSGYAADQIMPYVKAGVKVSDILTYVDAGVTYDTAKPYVDAGIPADKAVDEIKKGMPPTP